MPQDGRGIEMLLLHILLTILKILGILLLVVAGLLLLIVLALLFVPVTYKVQGNKSQETWGISGRVSWLFGGISARFWHRGEIGWELRLLGIPVRKLMRRLRGGKRRKRQEKKTSSGRKEKGASAQNGPSPSEETFVKRESSLSEGTYLRMREPSPSDESPVQKDAVSFKGIAFAESRISFRKSPLCRKNPPARKQRPRRERSPESRSGAPGG